MDLSFQRSLAHFFRDVPIFAPLGSDELREILRLTRPFSRAAGDVLFREGDPPDGLYVIERGEVVVLGTSSAGDPVTLAYLGNGAVIGEMALVQDGPRSATVEAVSATQGHWLARSRFQKLRADRHRAAYRVVLEVARTVEERRRATEARLVRLLQEDDRKQKLQDREVREMIGRIRKA